MNWIDPWGLRTAVYWPNDGSSSRPRPNIDAVDPGETRPPFNPYEGRTPLYEPINPGDRKMGELLADSLKEAGKYVYEKIKELMKPKPQVPPSDQGDPCEKGGYSGPGGGRGRAKMTPYP